MKVVVMPLEMLRPAPYNPRQELKPGDPRYRKLRRSLERFGLVEPLVWNQRTGHVVGGHQRLKILRDLGWREVPVSVVDLDPDRERALNVMLNNRMAQSDWDLEQLRQVLEELAESPQVALADTGFTAGELEMLRYRLEPLQTPHEAAPGLEVVLCLTEEQLETVRPELDALIERHGLVCHVRHRT